MKKLQLTALTLAVTAALGSMVNAQTSVTTTTGGTTGASTTAVTTTNSAGTISEFSPDTIVIRSETSPEPVRYTYSKTTTYVDETGAPVSMDLVKSGLPVTVYYAQEGDRRVANRVVVRRKKTTTTGGDAAVVEKRSSTTTTTTEK